MTDLLLARLKEDLVAHAGERVLCLSTTANVRNPSLFVGSPRRTDGLLAGNLIIRDPSLVADIVKAFDPIVSMFFADCEIKAGFDLSKIVCQMVAPGRLHLFKPNDFTVEAMDEWIAARFGAAEPGRAAIIGAGNIGTKIALRLAERGFEVRLFGRKIEKVRVTVAGLESVIRGAGRIVASEDIAEACLGAALVVGCTAGIPVVDREAVASVQDGAMLLDAGNGTFTREGISEAHRRSILVEVLAPSAGWDGFIRRFLITRQMRADLGRRHIDGQFWLVSRGLLGARGDVLVDSISRPTRVLGICDGEGDVMHGEEAGNARMIAEDWIGRV